MMVRRFLVIGVVAVLLCAAVVGAADAKKKPTESGECNFKGGAWKNHLSQTEKMWAGSLARLVAQTILHPLDTIRTRRQAAGGLKTTPKDWVKGIVPQMALAMPAGAVQFLAYEQTKESLNKLLQNTTMGGLKPHVIEICAAACGATAASIIRVPQERVKQPVQADMYPNFMAAIAGNLKSGGLGSFYTGFTATILRDIPWNTLSFFFFNIFKTMYEGIANSSPNQRDTMAIGAAGGAFAAVIMTPIDVVKTRLMLQKPDASGALPYNGILHALIKIAKDEGPGALMKGLAPRIAYLGPLASITMSIYEKIGKKILTDKGPNWCKPRGK